MSGGEDMLSRMMSGIFPAWKDFPDAVKDRFGRSFSAFMKAEQPELTRLLAAGQGPVAEDPTGCLHDLSEATANLASANERAARAHGFLGKAVALGERKLAFEESLTGNAAQRQVKGFLHLFCEIDAEWTAAAETLQEQVNTAKKILSQYSSEGFGSR